MYYKGAYPRVKSFCIILFVNAIAKNIFGIADNWLNIKGNNRREAYSSRQFNEPQYEGGGAMIDGGLLMRGAKLTRPSVLPYYHPSLFVLFFKSLS